MLEPKVIVPENPAGSMIVFTTVPPFIRFTVNGPVPPERIVLYVTYCPESSITLDGRGVVNEGNTIVANVFVTDSASTSVTVNSLHTSTITVNSVLQTPPVTAAVVITGFP